MLTGDIQGYGSQSHFSRLAIQHKGCKAVRPTPSAVIATRIGLGRRVRAQRRFCRPIQSFAYGATADRAGERTVNPASRGNAGRELWLPLMCQGGVVAKQTRVVQGGGVGVHLRPHAYQAAAERRPAPMGTGTVGVTVPSGSPRAGAARSALRPHKLLRRRVVAEGLERDLEGLLDGKLFLATEFLA